MSKMNLMLHCGAERVEREAQVLTAMPEKLGPRHNPIPFINMIEAVEQAAKHYGMVIRQEAFGALKDGSRFFGLMDVIKGDMNDEYTTVIGLRGSHDQSLSAGIVAGSGVFVCDNLCFSGEVKLNTKQTTNILDRLPDLVFSGMAKVGNLIDMQHDRFAKYKAKQLPRRAGDAAIIELVRRGAITPSQTGRVIEQWDTPAHEEHAQYGDSIWKLHNAVTEVYKPNNEHTNMGMLPERSQALTAFCDEVAGINW